eukprot:TRINITY_DN19223_c0_g1_i1.p1 TRINITY_DN19223_c0_g1~~TRINITY_DN19223_c0_g1_i1.p1  ORF type:complete len:762 (+),score=170.79 TRINITY_DN19223_c0_g1_i1:46-2331(+)
MRPTIRSAVRRLGGGRRVRSLQKVWYCTPSPEQVVNKQSESQSQMDKEIEPPKKRSKLESAFDLSCESLVSAFSSGTYKVEEVVEECIRKLQTDGSLYNSVISINLRAIYTAAALDESYAKTGKLAGPLHGVPFVVGDSIHVAGMPTTCGSRMISYTPTKTAPVVEALIAAGAICVAKANQDEFGLGCLGHNESTGTILNPLNPKRYAGGSQGGAVVSVATGCVPFAIGIDTLGDIRIPASYCNVIGFVPEVGAYSTSRTWSLSSTLGNIGIAARTVDDIKIIDGVMRSSTAPDESIRALLAAKPQEPIEPIDIVRTLVPEDGFAVSLDREVEMSLRYTLMILQMLNCTVATTIKESKGEHEEGTFTMVTKTLQIEDKLKNDRTLDGLLKNWYRCSPSFDFEASGRLLAICEKARVDHAELVDTISIEYVKKRLNSNMMFSEDLKVSEQATEHIRNSILKYWEAVDPSIDVLIFPTSVTGAPIVVGCDTVQGTITWNGVHVGMEKLTQNTGPVSLAGLPNITVPLGKGHRGSNTGLGLLIVGRPGKTVKLLEAARAIDTKIKIAAAHLLGESRAEREKLVAGAEDWLEDPTKNSFVEWISNKLAIGREGEFRQKKIQHLRMRGEDRLIGRKAAENHTTRKTLKPYTNAIQPPVEYPDADSHNLWKEYTPGFDDPAEASFEDERLSILSSINRTPDPNRVLKVLEHEEPIIRPHDTVPEEIAALGVGVPEDGVKGLKRIEKMGSKLKTNHQPRPQRKGLSTR